MVKTREQECRKKGCDRLWKCKDCRMCIEHHDEKLIQETKKKILEIVDGITKNIKENKQPEKTQKELYTFNEVSDDCIGYLEELKQKVKGV